MLLLYVPVLHLKKVEHMSQSTVPPENPATSATSATVSAKTSINLWSPIYIYFATSATDNSNDQTYVPNQRTPRKPWYFCYFCYRKCKNKHKFVISNLHLFWYLCYRQFKRSSICPKPAYPRKPCYFCYFCYRKCKNKHKLVISKLNLFCYLCYRQFKRSSICPKPAYPPKTLLLLLLLLP